MLQSDFGAQLEGCRAMLDILDIVDASVMPRSRYRKNPHLRSFVRQRYFGLNMQGMSFF